MATKADSHIFANLTGT